MNSEDHVLRFPIVSAITGEFTPEFLRWWPFDGFPQFMNNIEPYRSHIENMVGLTYVFRPKGRHLIVPIIPFCGFWQAKIMKVGEYRQWINLNTKSLDKARGL